MLFDYTLIMVCAPVNYDAWANAVLFEVTPVPGSFTRMSEAPLTEWHSFATITEPGKKGYSVIVSRAGDWTSRQIATPPTKLWIRGIPTCGVMRVVPLFRRVVLVATGSGIGPCAPSIFAKLTEIRLLWTAPKVRETYGDKFVDSIVENEPGAVIYDTRAHGKPDMVKLSYRLYKDFDAEAVCIISNKKLTDKVVYGLSSRGVPCYGMFSLRLLGSLCSKFATCRSYLGFLIM